MRTSISCQWCRRSKVKCHHDGTAPCRACACFPDRECVLSAPVISGVKRKRISLRHHPGEDAAGAPTPLRKDTATVSSVPPIEPAPVYLAPPLPLPEVRNSHDVCTAIVNAIPPQQVRTACSRLMQQYPNFGFLHKPTFFDHLDRGEVNPIKLCAIMALCGRHDPDLHFPEKGHETSQYLASAAREAAMSKIDENPDVDLAQTLIILSLHYWGDCQSFRAWVLVGLTSRITQTFRKYIKSSNNPNQTSDRSNLDLDDPEAMLTKEIATRTYWASFVLECMLCSGKGLPSNHHNFDLGVPLPLSEDDFEFGCESTDESHYLINNGDLRSCVDSAMKTGSLTLDNPQRILISGYQVWAELSQWICGGGRRTQEHSSACAPWRRDSRWYRLMASLRLWRSTISPRLYYSPNNGNLKVYVSRGQGEAFAAIHLLFCLNVIFLHREYIPFLAHRVRKPCGPVDPPLITEDAPAGWWEEGSKDLFEAAVSIIELMQALDADQVKADSPFTCFCVYSAGASLSYLHAWPHMAPHIKNAKVRYEWSLNFLDEACQRWPICQGWRKTLVSLDTLYRNINAGGNIYSEVGRDQFIGLEDRLHRFADAEQVRSDDLVSSLHGSPASQRGLSQSQQQHQRHRSTASNPNPEYNNPSLRPINSDPTPQPVNTGHPEWSSWDNQNGPFSWADETVPDFTASQDILGSILGTRPLADWFLDA